MRKDYISVASDTATADEADFVEQYWTRVWKDHGRAPDLSALARRDEYRIMQPVLATLPHGSRILDAGCGLGEWTIFLAQQGFDAVGLDLSAEVVDGLNAQFPGRRFVRGDIRRTEFASGSFDACFSWGAFEHFENGLGECLVEAHRIVRPGGWLFVSVPFQNWRHIFRDSRPLQSWDPGFDSKTGYAQTHRFYQWRFTRRELQRELELRGFRVVSVTPVSTLGGVGRWLQWDFRVAQPNTRAYFLLRRVFAAVMPASYISHMIVAAAQRR